jgi:hypothetical protein
MSKIIFFLLLIQCLFYSCSKYICPLKDGNINCPPKTSIFEGYNKIVSNSNIVLSSSIGYLGEFSYDSTYQKTKLVVFSGKYLEKRFIYLVDSTVANEKNQVTKGQVLGIIKSNKLNENILYYKIQNKLKAYEKKAYKKLNCECIKVEKF